MLSLKWLFLHSIQHRKVFTKPFVSRNNVDSNKFSFFKVHKSVNDYFSVKSLSRLICCDGKAVAVLLL